VRAPGQPIYQFDTEHRPDSDFEVGALRFLVIGNAGRLLDARRTPVQIVGLDLDHGLFEVEIRAFEDRGARWLVPFEDVDRYQFNPGSSTAARAAVAAYADTVRTLDHPLTVDAPAETTAASLEHVERERARAAAWLDENGPASVAASMHIVAREGDPGCSALLHAYLDARGVLDMDIAFSQAFVSNPNAGESIKGHAIVLAELGLCSYTGKVVRNPGVFEGLWTKERRGRHLFARLGFTQALWSRVLPADIPLFRAMASDGMLERQAAGSFVSATFSADVAMEHFRGGPTTRAALIMRQPAPALRMFMSFLETPAMSRPYKEAEAVLIADPSNPLF
jgi:hypothetical protein